LADQPSANPLDGNKAEKDLENYRQQILSGKTTFAAVAKEHSLDTGSKKQGGDLGWVTRGQMVKEFEDEVFNTNKGELTKPFKSKFGYHLAQVTDIEKEYKSTFSGVRAKVLTQFKKAKANQKLLDVAGKLAEKIKNKETLSKAANELGLHSSETAWFTQGKEIAGIKDSKNATQELVNLYPGEWAGPFPLGGKEYFFQLTEAKEGPATDKDQSIGQKFMAGHADDWFKNYLEQEKKTLNIKTYLNS
jgi:peptidyl-prolyl cis-trans isomerase D